MAKVDSKSNTRLTAAEKQRLRDETAAAFMRLVVRPYWRAFRKDQDQAALLELLSWYLSSGRRVPRLLVTEFIHRYDRWRHYEVSSLDEAFLVERGKSLHLPDPAKRERLRPHIALRVERLRAGGMSASRELFEIVAKDLDLGVDRAYVETVYNDPVTRPWRQFAKALIATGSPQDLQ
jgi:hypothetical protein